MIEWLYMLMGVAMGASILWLYKDKMIPSSWPYIVPIVQIKGGAKQWVFERARRFVDKRNPNIQKFRIRGSKRNLHVPDYRDVHIGKNGKPVLPLAAMQEGDMFPWM